MVLALAALAVASCGGRSAEEIATSLRTAIRSANPERRFEGLAEETRAAANDATCNALEIYSSKPAESFAAKLKRQADLQKVRRGLPCERVTSEAAWPRG
jgi:hypothetical protein